MIPEDWEIMTKRTLREEEQPDKEKAYSVRMASKTYIVKTKLFTLLN